MQPHTLSCKIEGGGGVKIAVPVGISVTNVVTGDISNKGRGTFTEAYNSIKILNIGRTLS